MSKDSNKLDFLDLSPPQRTYPLWGSMYSLKEAEEDRQVSARPEKTEYEAVLDQERSHITLC